MNLRIVASIFIVVIVAVLSISVTTGWGLGSVKSLFEKSYDGVHECDRIASHPLDPDGKAKGISANNVDVPRAIAVCKQAVNDYPGSHRFLYLYGRALHLSKRYDEALRYFEKAKEFNYAAAYFTVAVHYAYGLGVEVNYKLAKNNLERAIELGFPGQEYFLASISFDPQGYYAGEMLLNIYLGNSKSGDTNNPLFRQYTNWMARTIEGKCGYVMLPAGYTSGLAIRGFIDFMAGSLKDADDGKGFGGVFAKMGGLGAVKSAAVHDANLLMSRHGCNSDVAKIIFQNYRNVLGL